MFFKRSSDTEFTELGIGQMKVLPGSGEGVKAIMRNDTALAKVWSCTAHHAMSAMDTVQVLMNVRVTSAVPVSTKSNNVFLVCVPNPPLERKVKDAYIYNILPPPTCTSVCVTGDAR